MYKSIFFSGSSIPELANCHFDSMFDTVSVAPDSSKQFTTIVLRKRHNRFYAVAVLAEADDAMCSTRLPANCSDRFYAVPGPARK